MSVLENQVKVSFKLEKKFCSNSCFFFCCNDYFGQFSGHIRVCSNGCENCMDHYFSYGQCFLQEPKLCRIPKKSTTTFLPMQICVPLYVKICNSLKCNNVTFQIYFGMRMSVFTAADFLMF